MTEKQPQVRSTEEALRLADELDRNCEMGWPDYDTQMGAAAELRRLHEVNQELLEALRGLMNGNIYKDISGAGPHWAEKTIPHSAALDKAYAALAKAGKQP